MLCEEGGSSGFGGFDGAGRRLLCHTARIRDDTAACDSSTSRILERRLLAGRMHVYASRPVALHCREAFPVMRSGLLGANRHFHRVQTSSQNFPRFKTFKKITHFGLYQNTANHTEKGLLIHNTVYLPAIRTLSAMEGARIVSAHDFFESLERSSAALGASTTRQPSRNHGCSPSASESMQASTGSLREVNSISPCTDTNEHMSSRPLNARRLDLDRGKDHHRIPKQTLDDDLWIASRICATPVPPGAHGVCQNRPSLARCKSRQQESHQLHHQHQRPWISNFHTKIPFSFSSADLHICGRSSAAVGKSVGLDVMQRGCQYHDPNIAPTFAHEASDHAAWSRTTSK